VGGPEFWIEPDRAAPNRFTVHGDKPLRWIRQTDFDNDEAVGYLADRLARLGGERELADLGAEPGAAVTIGDVTFDWVPTGADLPAEFVPRVRGTDARLEQLERGSRPGAGERLAARRARRRRPGDESGAASGDRDPRDVDLRNPDLPDRGLEDHDPGGRASGDRDLGQD